MNNNKESRAENDDGFPKEQRWLSEGLEELLLEDAPKSPEDRKEITVDLVIVGSGYGGALAAAQLAGGIDAKTGQPMRVWVLERGREYLAGMFPGSEAELPAALSIRSKTSPDPYGAADGVVDLRIGKDVSVVQASGLGGGSLINAGVMERAQPWVFRSRTWPVVLREPGALDHWYDAARVELSPNLSGDFNKVHTSAKQEAFIRLYPQNTRVREQLDVELPRRIDSYIPTVRAQNPAGVMLEACKRCGDCMTGCNQRAKNSLDQNALVRAKRRRTRIICGANVMRIERAFDSRKEPCWDLFILHTDPLLRRRQSEPFRLRTRRIVLAAGSLGTTEILLRSRSHTLKFSSQLGERFSANGDLIAASYDEKEIVNAVATETQEFSDRKIGPTTTAMMLVGSGEQQIVIQEFAIPGPIRRLFSEGFTTSHLFHRLASGDPDFFHKPGSPAIDPYAVNREAIGRTQSLGVMGHDGAAGRLVLERRRNRDQDSETSHLPLNETGIEIRWPELKQAGGLFDYQMRTLSTLIGDSEGRGTLLSNPFWQLLPPKLTSVLDLKRGPALTTHPLGGCAMADTFHDGVVDPCGRVFDTASSMSVHEGLAVLDGSFIPRSLGINPALTISALVLRALDRLRREWQAGDSGEPPAVIPPMPSFKTVRPAEDVPTQVAIHERVVGDLHLESDPDGMPVYTAELTLQFKPASARMLATEMSRALVVDHEKSHLRIFLRTELQESREKGDSDFLCHQRAEFSANLSGELRVLDRGSSTMPLRILRGMYGWYRNRGKRDAWNALVSFLSGEKKSAKQLIPPGFLSVASHAGEIRLFEYALEIGDDVKGKMGVKLGLTPGVKLGGQKRLTYGYAANPWKQLGEITLTRFPGLEVGIRTTLELELKHFAREQRHLFEIVRERDGVTGLMELFSFLLFAMRVVAAIHVWSFRKPDTPPRSRGQRLPGDVPGMRSPEITKLRVRTFDHKLGRRGFSPVRLTRYRKDGASQPVLLIHGFSASGTTFAHPALNPGLARYLHDADRDVWVVDLRTSSGMSSSRQPWSFEQVAFSDIPKVVRHICKETGVGKIDVVAHCMGAAMLSMALLKPGRNKVAPYVRNVVLSQVGPMVVFTPANIFRAYCVRYIQHIFRDANFEFRPSDGDSGSFLDRLLASVPYPRDEFEYENPRQPWARTPFTTTRHRMDAWFGRVFNIANMEPAVLDRIDDFFGAINLRTSFQTIHFARNRLVTTRNGTNKFVVPNHMDRLKTLRLMSIHGAQNGLADPATLVSMQQTMDAFGIEFEAVPRLPGYGHQDCIMGRDAAKDVFPKLLRFLSQKEVDQEKIGPLKATQSKSTVQMPFMGPMVGLPDSAGNVRFAVASDPRLVAPTYAITIAANKIDDAWLAHTLQLIERRQFAWRAHRLIRAKPPKRNLTHWDDPPYWYQVSDNLADPETPPASLVLLVYDMPARDRDSQAAPTTDIWANENSKQVSAAGVLASIKAIDDVSLLSLSPLLESIKELLRFTAIEKLALAHMVSPAAPDVGAAQVRFAVASCQYPMGPLDHRLATSSYARLASMIDTEATRPRCILLLGDQIYADATAGVFDTTNLDDLYRLPYQEWLSTREICDVFRRLPMFAMLDDHEIENNWEASLPGRQSHNRKIRFGKTEYLKVQRSTDPNYLAAGFLDGPAWFATNVDGFDFFLCDTRTERERRSAANLRKKRIMGKAQAVALARWLGATAGNRPRFVASASMLLPRRKLTKYGGVGGLNSDAWDGYPASMERLLAYIANRQMSNLVFLSGDEHHSCIATVRLYALGESGDANNPRSVIHSIHSSALHAPFPFANGEPADLAGEEEFSFPNPEQSAKYPWAKIGVSVTTHFVKNCGDGFAMLECARAGAKGGWRIQCVFSRQSDAAPDARPETYTFNSC
jgi:cholesterol oxidase